MRHLFAKSLLRRFRPAGQTLAIVLFLLAAGCKKHSGGGPMNQPASLQTRMTGKWTINLFVFHHEQSTHYNGITPGYIRYRFHMSK